MKKSISKARWDNSTWAMLLYAIKYDQQELYDTAMQKMARQTPHMRKLPAKEKLNA